MSMATTNATGTVMALADTSGHNPDASAVRSSTMKNPAKANEATSAWSATVLVSRAWAWSRDEDHSDDGEGDPHPLHWRDLLARREAPYNGDHDDHGARQGRHDRHRACSKCAVEGHDAHEAERTADGAVDEIARRDL